MFGDGYSFGFGFICASLTVVLVAATITKVVNGDGLDDSDRGAAHRSGLAVHTDYKTGVQYLRAPGGGLTPRLNRDGTIMKAED